MTKENFINKWASVYNVNDTTNPYFVADLEAVIANEIAKVQEVKPQPEEPFDKDRFEAMFRAVVASGRTESYEQDFLATNICLEKLDAFYATKNN